MNHLLCTNNLDKHDIDIPTILYPIYKLDVEQLDHLLFKCKVEATTYDVIYKFLDFWLTHMDSPRDIFEFIYSFSYSAKKKLVIDVVVCITL